MPFTPEEKRILHDCVADFVPADETTILRDFENGKLEAVGPYIQLAYQKQKGIYSKIPEGQLDQEVLNAKRQFTNVVEEEEKRVKRIVHAENERVKNILSEKGRDVACPFCLEDFPAIHTQTELPSRMSCCGVRLCKQCGVDWMARMNPSDEMICFSCRRPVNEEAIYELAKHGGAVGKGFALSVMAIEQRKSGKLGKAWKTFEQAAKLDDPIAQSSLAQGYFFGYSSNCSVFKVQKSLEKARAYAERGADQGDVFCYSILAGMDDIGLNERLRLLSIASYQGMEGAQIELAKYYAGQLEQTSLSEKDLMNNAILGIYWSGKALEQPNPKAKQVIMWTLIFNLMKIVMRLWHKRSFFDIEPLTGCSHIPFMKWIEHQGIRNEPHMLHAFQNNKVWSKICAYCGSRQKEKLMMCARCKSFSYCSRDCQVKHWKAGHKVDCKGHWVESFFPKIRNPDKIVQPASIITGYPLYLC